MISSRPVTICVPARSRSAPTMTARRFHRSPNAPPKSTRTAIGTRLAASTSPSAPDPATCNDAKAIVNGTKPSPTNDSAWPVK